MKQVFGWQVYCLAARHKKKQTLQPQACADGADQSQTQDGFSENRYKGQLKAIASKLNFENALSFRSEVAFSGAHLQLLVIRNDLDGAELAIGGKIVGFVRDGILAAKLALNFIEVV